MWYEEMDCNWLCLFVGTFVWVCVFWGWFGCQGIASARRVRRILHWHWRRTRRLAACTLTVSQYFWGMEAFFVLTIVLCVFAAETTETDRIRVSMNCDGYSAVTPRLRGCKKVKAAKTRAS